MIQPGRNQQRVLLFLRVLFAMITSLETARPGCSVCKMRTTPDYVIEQIPWGNSMVNWNTEKEPGAVIVTGASRGIGAAVAKLVGAHGFPVVVNFTSTETAA